jgi:hypothetical protein
MPIAGGPPKVSGNFVAGFNVFTPGKKKEKEKSYEYF